MPDEDAWLDKAETLLYHRKYGSFTFPPHLTPSECKNLVTGLTIRAKMRLKSDDRQEVYVARIIIASANSYWPPEPAGCTISIHENGMVQPPLPNYQFGSDPWFDPFKERLPDPTRPEFDELEGRSLPLDVSGQG